MLGSPKSLHVYSACLYNCIHSAKLLQLYGHSVAERISIDSQSEGEESSMSHRSSSSEDESYTWRATLMELL